jgi:hypothetical protein
MEPKSETVIDLSGKLAIVTGAGRGSRSRKNGTQVDGRFAKGDYSSVSMSMTMDWGLP